jgi:hypothetical protein
MRIFSATSACAPAPTDIMQTTAATPTIIPSAVSALRSLFTQSDRTAIVKLSSKLMARTCSIEKDTPDTAQALVSPEI